MRDGPGDRAAGTGVPPDRDPSRGPTSPRSHWGHCLLALNTSSHLNTNLGAEICFPRLRRERRPGLRGKRAGRCPGRGPREAAEWGTMRTPKLFLHALYLLSCLYPCPLTRRSCAAARCACICARDFWGSGEEPPPPSPLMPSLLRFPPGAECPAEPARCGHGGQRGGPGKSGAAGSEPRGAAGGGGGPLAQPPRPPDLWE